MRYLHQEHGLSIRRVTRSLGVNRSSLYRSKKPRDDAPIIDELGRLAEKHPLNGFWKLYGRMRKAGQGWNHKRVYRIYKAMKLNLRRKGKKRLPDRIKHPLLVVHAPNIQWSMDFMNDTFYSCKRYRTLNIIDEFNWKFLEIEIDTSLTAQSSFPRLWKIFVVPTIFGWHSSKKGSRSRMDGANDSTATSGRSCSIAISFTHSRRFGVWPRDGWSITIDTDLMKH